MLTPRPVRTLHGFALALVLGIALPGSSQLKACSLPLDAFVVGLPADKFDAASGTTSPVNNFEGFIDTPGDNAGDNTGYLTLGADQSVQWRVYWDPTNNGAEPKNVKLLDDVPLAEALAKTIEITRGVTRKVYPMSVLTTVLQNGFGNKPMKLTEVYARDPDANGWAANKNRVTAPWEIPAGNIVKIDNADGSQTPFAPTMVVEEVDLGSGNTVLASSSSTDDPVSQVAKDDPGNVKPSQGSTYLAAIFTGTMSGEAIGQKVDTAAVTATRWRVVAGAGLEPEWVNDGGTWTFAGIDCKWEFNSKNTVYNPDPGNNERFITNATIVTDHKFITPSEPFFYRVKPTVTLRMRLDMPAGEYYEWYEEKFFNDPAQPQYDGIKDPATPRRRFRLRASGEIKKGNQGLQGGVATLIRAVDTLTPPHCHGEGTPFTGNAGAVPSNGSVKFAVVDNNPHFALSGAIPGNLDNGRDRFDPAGSPSTLYFSADVEQYEKAALTAFGIPGDMTIVNPAAAEFPVRRDEHKWFKKTLTGPQAVLRKFFDKNGSPLSIDPAAAVNSPYGTMQSPAFSGIVYQINASDLDKRQGMGHSRFTAANGSIAASSGTVTYDQWANRPKVFLVPSDMSKNIKTVEPYETVDNSRFATLAEPGSPPTFENIEQEASATPLANDGPMIAGNNWQAAINNLLGTPVCSCPPNALGNVKRFGPLEDKIRPSVALLIKDTKYNRTFVVNDQEQGWQKRADAQAALGGGSAPADNETNSTVLDAAGNDSSAPEIAFNDESHSITAQTGTWEPFSPGRRSGIFIDEDTQIVVKPYAWDSSNPGVPITGAQLTWEVVDQPAGGTNPKNPGNTPELGPNSDAQFAYTFHDPNRPGSGNCEIAVTARDGAGNERTIRVSFFVRSEKLSITTLEESTGNRR